MGKKLFPSLSIFFPFYNDEGTVSIQIKHAYETGSKLTDDLEVIALHGGNSRDKTWEEIQKVKKEFPDLKIVDKKDNSEGYAVIKHGFRACTKEYIFYTDGDYQYHLEEDLAPLAEKMISHHADVANGYKSSRSDNFIRVFLGKSYAYFSKFVFDIPIRDTDCDFRIIKKKLLDQITLESTNASILPELVKKLEMTGCKFVEMPVSHYSRIYGSSNYTFTSLFFEKLFGDVKLYFQMRKLRILEDKLRVFRFALVGALSLILQMSIFNFLILSFDLNRAISAFLSDQIPILISFIINNYFTFRSYSLGFDKETISKFIKFYAVVVSSTLIQTLVVLFGTTMFSNEVLWSNIFLILGLVFAFIWNYTIQSRLVWKKVGVKM